MKRRWWWLAAALVLLASSVALADGKTPVVKPLSKTHAPLFKLGKTWSFTAKHSFAEDGEIHRWTTRVSCKVTESTSVGTARRGVIACTTRRKGQQLGDLVWINYVWTNAAIWLVPDAAVVTEASIAALDPKRAWITAQPTERTWSEQVPVLGSSDGKMRTRSSWTFPWKGAWCQVVRGPDDENVYCASPKGLVGVRELTWPDGFSFGAIPTPKQAERWK